MGREFRIAGATGTCVRCGRSHGAAPAKVPTHSPMPGIKIGPETRPVVRAQAAPRRLESGHYAMPGIKIGPDPVVRANASTPRRHGESGHYYMPGLTIGRSAD